MAIVQRVSLEGGDVVVRQLEDLGKRGQKAVSSIGEAASKADFARLERSLQTISENGKRAGESLLSIGNKLTLLFGIEIAEGIGNVASSIAELGKASAEAVDDVADLATQAGATAQNMQAVLSVFRQTGFSVEGVGENMRRFTNNVQKAWEDIRTSVKDSTKTTRDDQLNVEQATLSLEQANINLAKSYKNLTAAAGDPIKMEQALLDVRQNQLNVAKQEQAVQDAQAKKRENEANSIENLRAAILGLARGTADLSNINVTAENLFKGIVAAAGPSIDSLKELGTNFNSLAATQAPKAKDVLYLLADVFKNLKDETLKTAIATQAFGRGVDIDLIKALSKGSEAFKAREKELAELGLAFDEADTKAADAFKDAFYNLTDLMKQAKDKLGSILTPLYTTLAEGFTGLLKNNVASLKESFEGIRDTFQPVVQGLSNVLKSVSFADFKKEAKDAFTAEQYINIELWQQRFEVLKQGASVVIEAFRGMRTAVVAILDEIAAMINAVFGTQISGDALGVGLLVARFSGLVAILNVVIRTVLALGNAIRTLTAISLANPWLALAAVVALVAVAIYTHWDKIAAAGKSAADAVIGKWNEFKTNFTALVDGLGKAWDYYWGQVKQKFSDFGTWVQSWLSTLAGWWNDFWTAAGQYVDSAVTYIKGKWADLKQVFYDLVQTMQGYWTDFVNWVRQTAGGIEAKIKAIASALSSAQQQAAAADTGGSPAMAGGGMVRGPGSGTSDSVLARLSAGEFVVRAAAVRRVGAGFLHAINRAPAFALGGLVDAVRDGLATLAVPMARGGPAPSSGGLRPFNLVMPGGGSYGGLFAQESAVSTLRKAAVGAQIASAGRRPAWVR